MCGRDPFGNPRCPWVVESSFEHGRRTYDNPSSYEPFGTRDDRLAYYINAYNALVLLGVVEHWREAFPGASFVEATEDALVLTFLE